MFLSDWCVFCKGCAKIIIVLQWLLTLWFWASFALELLSLLWLLNPEFGVNVDNLTHSLTHSRSSFLTRIMDEMIIDQPLTLSQSMDTPF